MGTRISELTTVGELRELERLFTTVWGPAIDSPIASETLRALAHSGNYVAGAYLEGRLAGGLVGWFGGEPPGPLHLHSHILGVIPGSEARGLGFELKQHQRSWCLDRGVKVIEWTTDPLVRRNAYFNLTKLGAEATQYLIDFYGEMTDGLNAGEESDRLLITWRLDSPQTELAVAGHRAEPNIEDLLAQNAAAVLSVGPECQPLRTRASARLLVYQVPEDIVALRKTDPALARLWRFELRSAMSDAMAAGYRVIAATRSGWYVLDR